MPPRFNIKLFKAFDVLLNSGRLISEYIAYIFPTGSVVKKKAKKPMQTKKINDIVNCKGVAA